MRIIVAPVYWDVATKRALFDKKIDIQTITKELKSILIPSEQEIINGIRNRYNTVLAKVQDRGSIKHTA